MENFRSFHGHGSIGLSSTCPGSARQRSGTEAVLCRLIMPPLIHKLKNADLLHAYIEIEMQIVKSIVWMELNGIGVSLTEIKFLKDTILDQLRKIEQRAHDVVGWNFKMNAPDEVGKALFVHLKLPPPEPDLNRSI